MSTQQPTLSLIPARKTDQDVLPLEPGDHLDQKTFHERYLAMPKHARAELIGGVVHMPSPLKLQHGENHSELQTWLTLYKAATPGTRAADNSTAILGEESEPQPDGFLRILPECGGQARPDKDNYLSGAPELVAEVGLSSASIDLHAKRRDYEKAGVREYVVIVVLENRIAWFIRRETGFVPLEPGTDGIYRSEVFPGLWLDAAALLRGDTLRVVEVLQQGLALPEHKAFVERLQRR